MRDRGERAVERAVGELAQEVVLVQVVGDVGIDQVHELVALLQVVDREHLVLAAIAQRFHDVRADEAGRAGYHDIHACFSLP